MRVRAPPPDPAEARARLTEALIRTGNEDRAALQEVYALTSAKLFGICLRICGERSAAEDVLHDVYLTIWKRAGAFEPGRASPISWLATIARNKAIDWIRARGARPAHPVEEAHMVADDSPDPLALAQRDQESQRLHDCLDHLDDRTRDAIRTAFFDGTTYAELAERKGVPLGTMKSIVRRGLLQLRGASMTTDADPDMTAAELALGLLEGEERATALRRMLADPAFAREVDAWRQRMAGLFDDYAEVPAPPSVAERLVQPERPARRRSIWPVLTVLTSLAAVVLLFFAIRPGPPPQIVEPHHMMVASLMMSDKSGAVPATVDMTTGEMKIPAAAMAPAGKSAQLWMIGDDKVPKPMGLLAADGPSKMMLPMEKRSKLTEGVTLAVSIEPVGGSPTGLPTGPVVASGKLSVA